MLKYILHPYDKYCSSSIYLVSNLNTCSNIKVENSIGYHKNHWTSKTALGGQGSQEFMWQTCEKVCLDDILWLCVELCVKGVSQLCVELCVELRITNLCRTLCRNTYCIHMKRTAQANWFGDVNWLVPREVVLEHFNVKYQ